MFPFLLAVLLVIGSTVLAQHETLPAPPPLKAAFLTPQIQNLRKTIESILSKTRYPALQASVQVVSADIGEILFELNPQETLIPASVNKILTAYTALKRLRPTGTFKTQVYTVGSVSNGVLLGDVYLKGGGDPSLVSERMWMLVNDFLRNGIKSVKGNIVGDATYFDEERKPASRPTYLTDQAYNAPVGALSFNFNTTTVYVRPGDKVGAQPGIYCDPENDYIDVVNQAKTGAAGTKNSLAVSRLKEIKGDLGDTVLLRGNIPLGNPEMRFYRNIVNPTLYAAHMFRVFLERRGVRVEGKLLESKVPANAKLLVEFDSQPMWFVVWGMNKFSNNFVADQIVKKIGAEMWGPPGTFEKGLATIRDTLEDIGIPSKDYVIHDGSGLTRKSRISSAQLVTVLRHAYYDLSIHPEFIASLGIAGIDGTLHRRFTSSQAKEDLRAKTGSLDGVDALAGYTTTADNEVLVFAIVLNDPKLKYGRMTGWIDQVATALRKFSRK